MSSHHLLKFIGDASKNILWQTGNRALFGIPEALKTTLSDTYTLSRISNEALYFLQVKTFLETIDLNEDEVNAFMENNPDHQRLGLEIFKILENTFLEKQAQMLAKAFKLYISNIIQKNEFDEYNYIITKINSHLINVIQELYVLGTNTNEPNYEFDIKQPNTELLNFRFLMEVPSPLYPGSTQIAHYKRTKFFDYFYEHIFKRLNQIICPATWISPVRLWDKDVQSV